MVVLLCAVALGALSLLLLSASVSAADGYGVANLAVQLGGLAASRLKHLPQGPFRVIPELVEPCPDDLVDMPFKAHITMRRDRAHSSIFYLTANMTTAYVFDDSIDAVIQLASWSSGGGWKENAFRMRFPRFCATASTYFRASWRRLMYFAFQDPNRTCPFPPGDYAVTNISTDIDKDVRNFPAFFYGKYRAELFYVHAPTNRRVSCGRGYGQVVPRYVVAG